MLDDFTYKKSERIIVYVDESEFDNMYRVLKPSKDNIGLFKSNIQLFTIAALIGKYKVVDEETGIIGKRTPIDKPNSYFRYKDNESKDEMAILKSLAIMEVNDVNIIKDQDAFCTICEEYARSGISELFKWYKNPNYDLSVELANIMLEFYKKHNLLI